MWSGEFGGRHTSERAGHQSDGLDRPKIWFEGSSLCMPTGLSHQTGRHFRSSHFWIPLFQILGLPNICSWTWMEWTVKARRTCIVQHMTSDSYCNEVLADDVLAVSSSTKAWMASRCTALRLLPPTLQILHPKTEANSVKLPWQGQLSAAMAVQWQSRDRSDVHSGKTASQSKITFLLT